MNRQETITNMTKDILNSVLFQTKSYIGSSTISVFTNKNALVFLALHCKKSRQGGLNDLLLADDWKFQEGSFIEFEKVLVWKYWSMIQPREDDRSNNNCHTLNNVWSKKLNAGQTVTFTSTQDYMELTFAIFVKEGSFCSILPFSILSVCVSMFVYVYMYNSTFVFRKW